MDKQWFDALPTLCKNRKYAFEEMHVLDCAPPKPVAVKVGIGHKRLPDDLWLPAEFLASVLQGEEVFEYEACTIYAFLVELLRKAIQVAGALDSSACLGHRGILSLVAARTQPAAKTAKLMGCVPPPSNAKSATNAKVATHEFSNALGALPADLTVGSALKIDVASHEDISVLQEVQKGVAYLFEGQNVAAESPEEATKHQEQNSEEEAATDEEPHEGRTTIQSADPAQQETAKQRRRKRRRERLRQARA